MRLGGSGRETRRAREPICRGAAGGVRGRPGVGQGLLQGTKHEIVDAARIAKPDLQLLRMRVDVDLAGIQV